MNTGYDAGQRLEISRVRKPIMTEKSLPQPSSPPGARQARSRTFTPYVLIWATLATLSLLYLVLLATQPTLVARYLGSGTSTAEADAAATRQAIEATSAEVRALRDTVDLFRNELIEMRTQITSQSDAARDLATRIAALETPPAEAQRTAKDAKAPVKAKPAEQAAAAPAPKEKAPPKKAAAKSETKSETGLETGSVAQPAAGAITFGPPTVTPAAVPPPPASGPVGVQIATGPSLDSMRLNWTLLSERHAESFRALEPRYTIDMSGSTETYNLIVGPLGSVDEAKRLCQELAAKATACSVSRFSGGAL